MRFISKKKLLLLKKKYFKSMFYEANAIESESFFLKIMSAFKMLFLVYWPNIPQSLVIFPQLHDSFLM
jgi:hypothetical protein